ncbi:MAG: FecR domain-containing protein [Clostridium sp.]|nr:FecR domain-containing protein [Acetatifactor muris]MCM1527093.1 FecR domain-containing protein [Bacteroides sp.]MCM1563408.1 FecR domain-containing protein [Clostridium sp.]
MKKLLGNKKMLAFSVAAIACVVIIAAVLMAGNRDQTYRSIKIVEMEGTVTIDREGINDLSASVNMNLMSGDHLTTGQDAYVVLRLDTDKYVMLGECGAMKVIAQGTEANAKTSIELESGSVLSEIQKPLGQDSSYDIITPNATMSVRGTVFEVRKEENEHDGSISVLVYDGRVAVGLDGAEPMELAAGEFTQFTAGPSPKFLTERGAITADLTDERVLERLQEIEQGGRQLNIDNMIGTASQEVAAQPSAQEPSGSDAQEPTKSADPETQEQTKPADQAAAGQEESKGQSGNAAGQSTSAEKPTEPSVTQPAKKPSQSAAVSKPAKVTEPIPEETKEAIPEPDDTDDDEDESVRPAEPIRPADPTKPTEPINPADPTKPTEPIRPEDPVKPTEPVKPGPTDPTEPVKPDPTDPTKPTEPVKPEPPEPAEGEHRVLFYCPYIASWSEQDGVIYSVLANEVPVLYMSLAVKDAETVENWQSEQSLTVTVTPQGWRWAQDGSELKALELTFAGWCTKDGREWDFENDAVTEDLDLYSFWEDKEGRKYYPEFSEDGVCNSVLEGSVVKGSES